VPATTEARAISAANLAVENEVCMVLKEWQKSRVVCVLGCLWSTHPAAFIPRMTKTPILWNLPALQSMSRRECKCLNGDKVNAVTRMTFTEMVDDRIKRTLGVIFLEKKNNLGCGMIR